MILRVLANYWAKVERRGHDDVSWSLIDTVRQRKARASVPDFVGTSNLDDVGRVPRET